MVGIAPSPPSIRFSALSLENRQHPCLPCHKGRWIDGKAQTVALLRFNCDTPALFITKPFCRQDGGIVTLTFAPHPTLAKPHYPSKIANTLASLVKGRWIDGKAQTVALLCLNCDTPALFITKPFCCQDGGIAAPTFAPHYPTRFSCCEFDSLTSHKNKIRPRFHGGELISISLSGVWGVAPSRVRATAPLPAKIKSAPVFTGANSSSH